jgi:RHS repeat-associated protein
MTATYAYFADDEVRTVNYGNGTSTAYEYDAARRMTKVEHRNTLGFPILTLAYTYDSRDLPIQIVESSMNGELATVRFEYDALQRLTRESRQGMTPYDMSYSYDAGGNRRMKIDWANARKTVYHYDIDVPGSYASNNNRLEYYDEFDFSGGPDEPVSTTWYYYNIAGNVKRIVTENLSSPGQYSGVRLGYAQNRQAVTYVIGETWTGNACPLQNHAVQFVREFRYDTGRARYLNRELDPLAYQASGAFVPVNETWTDYEGDEPYGDFAVDTQGGAPTIAKLRSFEPGMGTVSPWTSTGGANTSHYHGDLIGTTRSISDSTGMMGSGEVYTAFGERISTTAVDEANRYGYAGAWGYQAHSEFPFLHVGARYYDPATGRFLQRDPIGIRGGLNVYNYVRGAPASRIDPDGLNSLKAALLTGTLTAAEILELLGYATARAAPYAVALVCGAVSKPVRTPARNRPPNSIDIIDYGDGNVTIRTFGPDGSAVRDVDFGHDHGSGDPHVHPWDWGKTPPRLPGRPPLPGEALP